MLKGILSIGGKPGLYKMISQTKNGLIVESLTDNKRIPAFSSAKISALEDISVFTEEEDIPLADIFKVISEKENGGACLDPKSDNEALKKYMEEILPSYDKERVYVSDIKKILSWYNILSNLDMLKFDEEKEEEKDESTEVKSDKKETKTKTEKSTIKKAAPKNRGAKNASVKTSSAKKASNTQPKTKSK